MKSSNILIAFIILFSISCTSKNSGNDHGHEHDEDGNHIEQTDISNEATDDHGHEHDEDGNHIEQEEFSLEGESTTTKGEQVAENSTRDQQNETTVLVPAKKGVEYKFYLNQYEKITYEWSSEAPLYFDFHGEPLDYETSKYFESYGEAVSDNMKGTATMPFEGFHGWYWKNNTEKDVLVTLKTKGNYRIIGLKK